MILNVWRLSKDFSDYLTLGEFQALSAFINFAMRRGMEQPHCRDGAENILHESTLNQ